jgi:hypothetical protein
MFTCYIYINCPLKHMASISLLSSRICTSHYHADSFSTIQFLLEYTCQQETDNMALETQHLAHLHSLCTDHICCKRMQEKNITLICSYFS